MPRLKDNQVPSYRLHKQSGQAVVTLSGRDILLGKYDSPASRQEYRRLTAEWLANGRCLSPDAGGDLTVVELIAKFFAWAKGYYRRPDGTPTSEAGTIRDALRPLKALYGPTRAADFGPLALKAVGEEMIRLGWCRTNINRQLARVKLAFKWAAGNGMVPPAVHHGLTAVTGLRAGRTAARESDPVRPVPDDRIAAVLPHLTPTVRDMVELQLLTGMRPGEVCAMRGRDLDTTGRLWVYRPPAHKNTHRGHDRAVYLGPKAQAVVGRRLRPDLSAPVFFPATSAAEGRATRAEARKTPPGRGNGPGTNRVRNPKRTPGAGYRVTAYRHAVARACERAFGMPTDLRPAKGDTPEQKAQKAAARAAWHAEHAWHPHQLRHTTATRLRKEYGLEAAQVILGHRTLSVTEVYAEKNVAAAQRIMGEVG